MLRLRERQAIAYRAGRVHARGRGNDDENSGDDQSSNLQAAMLAWVPRWPDRVDVLDDDLPVYGLLFLTNPSVAFRRTRSPVRKRVVASRTLASAGMPNSRATVDACDSTPPTST